MVGGDEQIGESSAHYPKKAKQLGCISDHIEPVWQVKIVSKSRSETDHSCYYYRRSGSELRFAQFAQASLRSSLARQLQLSGKYQVGPVK